MGEAGRAAWKRVWALHWVVPERHMIIVTRYCTLQDLLARALSQVENDGMTSAGSTGQRRTHPLLVEVRLLSTECRLIESELGLTPASESRAGATKELPRQHLDDLIAKRRRILDGHGDDDDGDGDDPRKRLRPVN
ncbi:hypothetical protein AWC03_21330 [Mycobacterium europaeum]|nr:hypothetical protein AWC03_21330 [Mycobacterium europaeum]